MITLTKIRQLDIEPTEKSRPHYVYAASGLAQVGNRLYIVADDELHLAVFDQQDSKPGKWIRLLQGNLPIDYDERKKAKPDLESITHIPPYEHAPHGALLVVPSMSRKTRINGMLLALDQDQQPTEQVIPIDFSELRPKLTELVQELNIEGIVISTATVKLFHRGSKDKSKSAVFELDAAQFLNDLHDSHTISPKRILKTTEYELGIIEDVPLQFTDAVRLPEGRILFLATAENSTNAYDDGVTHGSAAGILDSAGKIKQITLFEGKEKLEGVSAKLKGSKINLLLVSDTDNQTKPANLFSAELEI
jgi:hypothetical protein